MAPADTEEEGGGAGSVLSWFSFGAVPPEAAASPASADSLPAAAAASVRRGPVGKVSCLRQRFQDADPDGSGIFTRDELSERARHRVQAEGSLDTDMSALLEAEVQHRSNEMDLGLQHDGAIGCDEWVHAVMLRSSAPNHVSAESLNSQLRRVLAHDNSLLQHLLQVFDEADTQGTGRLSQSQCVRALRNAGAALQGSPQPELNKDGRATYFEFMSCVFGAKRTPVELAMYDISGGYARWIPRMCTSGHKFQGIWHTGVRVFGKEYWYGGGVFEQAPGDTPFGSPVRVLHLGETLRTRQELKRFINDHLRWEYSYASYDVFAHNCNCFSNELTLFLLPGVQIPEEVRMQPTWAEHGFIVKALRPILNRLLGQFGEESGRGTQSRIDDLTEEWRCRLREGDIVLHRKRFVDPARVAWIANLQGEGKDGSAGLVMFGTPSTKEGAGADFLDGDWEVVSQPAVPLRELFPCAAAGPEHLRVGAARGEVLEVLRRDMSKAAEPSCTKGHVLQSVAHKPFSLTPPCSICGLQEQVNCACAARDKGRLTCVPCGVEICGKCVEEGASLSGGGVFADILTPALARDLASRERWLSYKAESYFFKADYDWDGHIDDEEVRSLADRLRWELDLEPWALRELGYGLLWNRGERDELSIFVEFFRTAVLRVPPPKPSDA